MILDKLIEFCDSTVLTSVTTVTGSNAGAVFGNVIDLGGTTVYPANSDCVFLVVQVPTAATSGGSATGTFSLISHTAATLTGGTTHWTSSAIAVASMTAGAQLACFCLPRGAYKQYLGLWLDVNTADFTAGKIDAFLTDTPPTDFTVTYADGLAK